MTPKIRALAWAPIAALAVGVTGCGGPANRAGDTTCADFLAMSDAARTTTMGDYLAAGGTEATALEIELSVVAAGLFCEVVAEPEDPITGFDE